MASVDRGTTVQVIPSQRGGIASPAFNAGQIALKASVIDPLDPRPTTRHVAGGFNGAPTLDHSHPGRLSSQIGGIGNPSGSIPGVLHYYKMRGYYVAGLTWETWEAIGAPSSTPPSGHTLDPDSIQVAGQT